MKRHGFLWDQIVNYDNLAAAHAAARRGKTRQDDVRAIDERFPELAVDLLVTLERGEYRTSDYTVRTLVERGKERVIHRLPYWPDRVVHHAVARVLSPIWRRTLIRHTYGSLPGRGIHDAARTVREQLRSDPAGTRYALKLDVRKFYPSIPHEPLIRLLGRQVKDPRVLDLISEIVRSVDVTGPGVGLPIGNYLSQWFANLYLSPLDHRVKEHHRIRHYHRYCDDMVLLHESKDVLHEIRADLEVWLRENFLLDLKSNWQVFPVADRGIDFVGYRMFPEKTLLRKGTKKRMAARLSPPALRRSPAVFEAATRALPAYEGWTRFGSTHNLRDAVIAPAAEVLLRPSSSGSG